MANTSDLVWQNSSAPTHGTIGDINTMRISPDYLGMAQDVIIDTNGIMRNRGAFRSITSDTFSATSITSAVQTASGTLLVEYDSTGHLFAFGTAAAALTGFAKLTATGSHATPTTQELQPTSGGVPYFSFAKLPNDNGAIMAGQGGAPTTSNTGCYLWGGNAVTTSDTIAGTAASTRGSKAIVGVGTAWTSALVNTYLYIGTTLVGQVDQVTSTTAIVLRKGAYTTVAATAPVFKCIRPTQYIIYKGRITTNTASAIIIGANTKFFNSGPNGGGSAFLTGDVFRNSDGAFVGTITSIQNDTTLTLVANAAIALTNEEYYIIKAAPALGTGGFTNIFFGQSVEQFADRYWYGAYFAYDTAIIAPFNASAGGATLYANSLAFTKKREPEHMDLDPTAGDVITVPTGHNPDSIRGLFATRGGLLVFRAYDTFLVTGYSPETFKLVKILDDGISTVTSAKLYKEGVVWAGQKTLWYFDGTKITDLLEHRVRNFFQRTSKIQNAAAPLGLAVSNDHLIVSYRVANGSGETWPSKNTTKLLLNCTMVLNMVNGAISFFTNLFGQTSFVPNAVSSSTQQTSVIIAWDKAATNNSFLLNGNTIFQDSATAADNFDAQVCGLNFSGQTIGPDVMFETTKLTMGDASRLKFWKRFLMNYSSDVSMSATFISTNDTTQDFPNRSTGTVSADVFAASPNVGILHRLRFLIRAPVLMIRVYQTNAPSSASQRFKCLWWSVGGKTMRQGRVQP